MFCVGLFDWLVGYDVWCLLWWRFWIGDVGMGCCVGWCGCVDVEYCVLVWCVDVDGCCWMCGVIEGCGENGVGIWYGGDWCVGGWFECE